MPERPYAQNAFESMRERRKREMESRLARVKELRISYQRKIIGTAVIFFIILIIVCALLPSDDAAGMRTSGTRISIRARLRFCKAWKKILSRFLPFFKNRVFYKRTRFFYEGSMNDP